MNKRAYNAKVPMPVAYKGRSYESLTDLFGSCGDSRCVSIEAFLTRVRTAWRDGCLTETRLEDALTLSKDRYRKVYGNRVTWVEVGGERRDLGNIYAEMSENRRLVPYRMYWTRIRNLRRRLESLAPQLGPIAELSEALLIEAATADNASWRRGWGAARISPLVHREVLYPTYRAFVHAMGRQDDFSLISNRLKRGVSPENALEPRVSRSGGLIYLIVQKSTGLEYIGLTSIGLEKRWADHVRDAGNGSTQRLHEAIRNAGGEDFHREVLEDGIKTEIELCERESYYIERFGTIWPDGFNSNRGGTTGGGKPMPCTFDGEEFLSVRHRNEILGERYDQAPWTIARLIRDGRPLNTPVRKVHDEHLGNETWQRQWRSVVRSADRGEIELWSKWREAVAWMRDIAPDRHEGDHLVHLDPTKPFAPGNFAWMTNAEKMAHQHGTAVSCHGKDYASLTGLALAYNLSVSTLKYRISQRGMTPEEAVSAGPGPTTAKQIEVDGVSYPSIHKAAAVIAEKRNIPFEKARYRLRRDLDQRAGGRRIKCR